jgi:TRAP-type C4-dicarboxylate transport system permease small subunit
MQAASPLPLEAKNAVSIDEGEISNLGAIPSGFLRTLNAWLNALGGLVIFALLLLINSDVLGRFLFNRPIAGVPEIAELAIVVIVFLQIGNAVGSGRFIRSDEFHKMISRHSPRLGNLLAALYELAGAGLIALLFAGTIPVFLDSWQNGRYMGNPGVFTVPVWPVQLTIIVGSGLTALVFLYAAILRLKNLGKRPI